MPEKLFPKFQAMVERVGSGILNLEPWIIEELKTPKREVEKKFSAPMRDGSEKEFTVFCVKHNETLGVHKGGIRALAAATEVIHDTLKLLAGDMTLKVAVVKLPFGGAKTWLNADSNAYTRSEWEAIIKEMTAALDDEMGPEEYVPAPDVGTGSQEMAWIFDAYQQLHRESRSWGVVTGKPLALHGSEGREIATSQGGQFVLRQALRNAKQFGLPFSDLEGRRAVIQGFGKVGYHFANLIQKDGVVVIAVSDSRGGVLNENGLDIAALKQHKKDTGSVINFGGAKNITQEELLTLECDILAPAAKENVITLEIAPRIRAKIILELANGPVAPDADEILGAKSIFILPDILANAGGVTVSYFEWGQNNPGQHWSVNEVEQRLEYIMNTAVYKVLKTAYDRNISNRLGAYTVAIETLAEAMRMRGQYKLKPKT